MGYEETGNEIIDAVLERIMTQIKNSAQSSQDKATTNSPKKKKPEKKTCYNCNICKDTSWIISFDGKATRCKCFEYQLIKDQLQGRLPTPILQIWDHSGKCR